MDICQTCGQNKSLSQAQGLQCCERCSQDSRPAPSLRNGYSGFICVPHSNKATHYCMCSGTAREYLCEECFPKHMKKPLNHVLVLVASLSVSYDDIPKLNRKMQVKETLNGTIRDVMRMLGTEKESARRFLEEYEVYHVGQLKAAYEALQQRLNAEYEKLEVIFQGISEDLRRETAAGDIPINLALFIDYSYHLLDSPRQFINVQDHLNSSISLTFAPPAPPSDTPLESLLATWTSSSPSKCECDQCEEYRDLFNLPMQSVWTCYNCRTENKAVKMCQHCFCGREWVDYLSCNDVKLSGDGKKWICPHCQGKNGLYEGYCKCKKPNQVVLNGLSSLPKWLRKVQSFMFFR